jgi:hypothetical protein
VIKDVVENWHLSRLLFHGFFQVPQTGQNHQLAQSCLPVGGR